MFVREERYLAKAFGYQCQFFGGPLSGMFLQVVHENDSQPHYYINILPFFLTLKDPNHH